MYYFILALKGVQIISQIYSYVSYSYANYLKRVLFTVSQPLFNMIRNWIIYGDLNDSSGEFFVRIHGKIEEDEIWNKRYEIFYQNVPIFADKEFYDKIFSIGKCVNFIKRYCNLPQFNLNSPEIKERLFIEEEEILEVRQSTQKMEIDDIPQIQIQNNQIINDVNELNNAQKELIITNINKSISNSITANANINFKGSTNSIKINNLAEINKYILNQQKLNVPKRLRKKPLDLIFSKKTLNALIDLPFLKIEIDVLYKEINKYLVEILFKQFYFEEHLKSIYNYLLMGQGDMMQCLMDAIFTELDKNSNYMQEHILRRQLDNAVSSSNAQYDKFKYNVDIKLRDSRIAETGWDLFLLQYKVSLPLVVIFTKKNMIKYEELFCFFWKLKRLEFSKNHAIWRNFMTQFHFQRNDFCKMRPYIHRAMLFNQQIIHFITTLHTYITHEVLGNHTKKFKTKILTVDNLDDLISFHNNFVNSIIEQSLLNEENRIVYNNILQIFEVIFRFKEAVEVLNSTLMENYFIERKKDRINYDERYIQENVTYSKGAFNQIKLHFEDFTKRICELIKLLENASKGEFKFLAMKLDFNGFYSDLETRNLQNHFYGSGGDEDEENLDNYGQNKSVGGGENPTFHNNNFQFQKKNIDFLDEGKFTEEDYLANNTFHRNNYIVEGGGSLQNSHNFKNDINPIDFQSNSLNDSNFGREKPVW